MVTGRTWALAPLLALSFGVCLAEVKYGHGLPGEDCMMGGNVIGYCEEVGACLADGGVVRREGVVHLCRPRLPRLYVCCRKPQLVAKELCDAWSHYWRRGGGRGSCVTERPLIVGGVAANLGEFPHMAIIGKKMKNRPINYVCGGTLISPHYILTAAHCLYGHRKGMTYWAKLGEHDRLYESEQDVEVLKGPIPSSLFQAADLLDAADPVGDRQADDPDLERRNRGLRNDDGNLRFGDREFEGDASGFRADYSSGDLPPGVQDVRDHSSDLQGDARNLSTASRGLLNGTLGLPAGKDPVQMTSAEQLIELTDMKIHPQYNGIYYLYHDIALVRLKTPARLTKRVLPACLPQDPTEDYRSKHLTVVGWGYTHGAREMSRVLQKVTIPVVDRLTCSTVITNALRLPRGITQDLICAGERERDSCQGDSGGPLTEQVSQDGSLCEHTVAGVVSFGVGQGFSQCGRMGVYTRVSNYLDWITGHIAPNSTGQGAYHTTTTTTTTSSTTISTAVTNSTPIVATSTRSTSTQNINEMSRIVFF